MNKIILTGRIEDIEKRTFDRKDGTEGFVGIFTIKLIKRHYELIELKTFQPEVWDKVGYGKLVYVEGSLKGREYEGKWYSDLTIYEIEVLEKEKEEKKFKKWSADKNESPTFEKTPDPEDDEDFDEDENLL